MPLHCTIYGSDPCHSVISGYDRWEVAAEDYHKVQGTVLCTGRQLGDFVV